MQLRYTGTTGAHQLSRSLLQAPQLFFKGFDTLLEQSGALWPLQQTRIHLGHLGSEVPHHRPGLLILHAAPVLAVIS